PDVLLEQRDGLIDPIRLDVGHGEVVPAVEGVGMVGPEGPRQALVRRPGHPEHLGVEPAAMPEDVRQLAEGLERWGAVGPVPPPPAARLRPPPAIAAPPCPTTPARDRSPRSSAAATPRHRVARRSGRPRSPQPDPGCPAA